MYLIDSHCHLNYEDFQSDLDDILKRAKEKSIYKIVIPAVEFDSINTINKISSSHPEICFPCIGLHPTSVKENYKTQLATILSEINNRKYYAIGEIGLDLYWEKDKLEQQVIAFETQLNKALEIDLPVIIHCRKAFDEILSILKTPEFKNKIRGVFHCFSGDENQAKQVIDMNYKLGIGGVVTYKNSGLLKIVKAAGIDNIILETDAPFLAPLQFRGKRNEPSYIYDIAKFLSDSLNIEIEKIAEITTKNTEKLFGI